MSTWGPDGQFQWQSPDAALGLALLHSTPEARFEQLPRWLPEQGLAFATEARLDNREELWRALNITPADRPKTADGDLVLAAYLKWGNACPQQLVGDWSLVAWHPLQRRLFLARDHSGNTGLYFSLNQRTECFAFASSPQALHAMGIPRRLNEALLAQGLVSWTPDRGSQTIDLDIDRLPPGHILTVTPDAIRLERYWHPEQTPTLYYARLDDYLEGFLDIFGQAVRARCRSLRPVGVTLSGGLDSGSVAALAGRILAEDGRVLTALTQVPIADTSAMVGERRFGDETRFACATAASLPNLVHHCLPSDSVTPMAGIELALAVLGQPSHAASNAFWIADLLQSAQHQGIGTLLTGQGGNATISWTGAPELRSALRAFSHAGWKAGLRRLLPADVLRTLLRWWRRKQDWSHTAIHPAFAHRMQLAERMLAVIGNDPSVPETWRTPRDKRFAIIEPGSSSVGELWSLQGAAHGMEVRDPTLDPRVVAYTLSVPDHFFDVKGGLDRQLIRQAMAGLLPDLVRLNPLRGRQSADLAVRLQRSAAEVGAALAEVSSGPAVEYLDVPTMRRAWVAVRAQPDPLSTHRAGSILLRGLMAGLWLNRRLL